MVLCTVIGYSKKINSPMARSLEHVFYPYFPICKDKFLFCGTFFSKKCTTGSDKVLFLQYLCSFSPPSPRKKAGVQQCAPRPDCASFCLSEAHLITNGKVGIIERIAQLQIQVYEDGVLPIRIRGERNGETGTKFQTERPLPAAAHRGAA